LSEAALNNEPIVLFDGVCSLCNTSVDFLVRNEKGDQLKFASLQSDLGKDIISIYHSGSVPDSILFYNEGTLYAKSSAIFKLCTFLKFPYSLLRIFKLVPRFISDNVYDWVAKNRYAWFGKKETCRIPTAEERSKFLG